MAAISDSSYFCLPEPGKPGPYRADGTRSRLEQKGTANGLDCSHCALQILRGDRRIGKDPRPEQVEDRLKEQKISAYRKRNTKLSEEIKGHLAFAKKLFGDLSKESFQQFLPTFAGLCEDFKDNKNAVKLLKLVGAFCEQDTFTDFMEYLIRNDQSVKERIKVCEEFFSEFNVALEDVYAFVPKILGKWEDLGLTEKYNMMMCYVFFISYSFYGCEYSSWRPDQSFSHFMQELRSHGPLMVGGCFGQSSYEELPVRINKLIEGREVYGWSAGAKRKQLRSLVHAIVIVGAEQIGERQYVYFLDPSDSSKPGDVKSQKVKVMTYSRLCSSIATISGLTPKNDDIRSWLAGLEEESVRIKSFAIYLKPLPKVAIAP